MEGIRPVLPLIRNTPYGKRIQNKLQREHVDNYAGGYPGPQAMVNMGLGNQGIGLAHGHVSPATRHLPPNIPSGNHLTDVYGPRAGLYSQGSYGLNPMAGQLHNLGARSIDEYVLQSHSAHNTNLTPPHTHAGGYSGYTNVSPFGNAGLTGSLNDPYQSYGYGM